MSHVPPAVIKAAKGALLSLELHSRETWEDVERLRADWLHVRERHEKHSQEIQQLQKFLHENGEADVITDSSLKAPLRLI